MKDRVLVDFVLKRGSYIVKAMKRLKKYYDVGKAADDAVVNFQRMLEESDVFRKLVFGSLSGKDWDRWFSPLVFEKVLRDPQMREDAELVSFLLSLYRLEVEYDVQIEIIRKCEEEIEFYPIYGRLPDRFLVSMKGMEAKLESRDSYDQDFIERSVKVGSYFDETEINDLTTDEDYERRLDNPLVTYLINTSEVIPSIVKYTRRETGYKRLFISLPAGTSVATFFRYHGSSISKIHRDFFKRRYSGRPESKFETEDSIRKALQEYEDKSFSMKNIHEVIGPKVMLAPSTLKTHYRGVLRKWKKAKKPK